MSGAEAAAIVKEIPALITTCVDLCKTIYQFIDDYRHRWDVFNNLDKRSNIRGENLMSLLSALGILYDNGIEEKHAESILGRLMELSESLTAIDAKLRLWEKKLSSPQNAVMKVVGNAMFVGYGAKSVEKVLDTLEDLHMKLSIDTIVLLSTATLLQNSASKLSTVSKRTSTILHVQRVMRARELEEQGHIPRIDTLDLGFDATFDPLEAHWDCGVTLGKKTCMDYRNCVFDHRTFRTMVHRKQVLKDTQRITVLLSDPDAGADVKDNGLLRCCGFIERPELSRFELVFRLPPDTVIDPPPCTLRTLLSGELNAEGPQHSIDDRLRFSTQLAHSVFLVHSARLVHKNIRPESILVTEDARSSGKDRYPKTLGTPYLIAFGEARSDSVKSERLSYIEKPMETLVYHHPTIQEAVRSTDFCMQDDIYSLGVCLLEIALWKSFFRWDPNKERFIDDPWMMSKFRDTTSKQRLAAEVIKDNFLEMARSEIPKTMGPTFSGVVVACLDSWGGAFGKDEKEVDIRFTELVLDKLHSISY